GPCPLVGPVRQRCRCRCSIRTRHRTGGRSGGPPVPAAPSAGAATLRGLHKMVAVYHAPLETAVLAGAADGGERQLSRAAAALRPRPLRPPASSTMTTHQTRDP